MPCGLFCEPSHDTHTIKLFAAALLIAATSAATAATLAPQQQEHAQQQLEKCMAAGHSVCRVHSDAQLIALMRKVQQTTIKHLQVCIDKCGLKPGQKLEEMMTRVSTCNVDSSKP